MSKPTVLHLGDDIRWNHDFYAQLQEKFTVKRSYSMNRDGFKDALKSNKFGDFVAMYRPFWNTGGEMGNWDDELISLLPQSCKIYASAGAGFDWVDTKRMAESGIIYCNSAAACTESVADAAIWLILSTYRLFNWSSACARSCDVEQFKDANRNIAAMTHNPNGSTLGIIGLGKIGYRIAQKAFASFGMRVIYNDIRRMPTEMEEAIDATYYQSLDEMLAKSDCTVVATPFAGNMLLDADKFAKIKHGSRLVNIARGKLIDEGALISALQTGQLISAGLDVHYNEPVVNPILAKMRNVELLSHTAGASVESHVGFERLGIENILTFFKTGQALTPVNMQWIDRTKM
ncbi:D-isomer specific 2-hydroxyacid dehydrogenase [Patellaria atrata CBS 101060]|uniref:D-isomer specific 2-hydroxyacid dehydrogenase n=1 Tax=Patellaria atrata CBS 101060 TaxID=1346257 RepID=A0A9P4SDT7_9PEZI|nr:D-isomer specific 2-hydroxyacid dehydrogenase [Patellaria atrata CBS 101060]